MTTNLQVVLKPEPTPAVAPTQTTTGEPADVLKDKFGGDVSKLSKSYSEAETEMGKLRAQIADLTKGITKPADAAAAPAVGAAGKPVAADAAAASAEADKAALDVAKAAGLDYEQLSKDFAANGKISDEQYSAFAKIGVPRSVVDDYINTKMELTASSTEKVLAEVGIKDYTAVSEWAAKGGYNAEQLKAYNAIVSGGDVAQQKQALSALNTAYVKAKGQNPSLLKGDGGGGGTAVGYRDRAEWMADVNNPKYKQSEAFRNDVKERLRNSGNI